MLSASRQRQQFVVPIDVQVIFILGLEWRQNSSAFIHLAMLKIPLHFLLEHIFMVRLWFVEP
ncbi:MAG: hypothetical protein AUI12_17115 [Acidobacteria bacterium 13_2_20CM_2_57_6]|nr:MAG: hypothetical protein AUI12_17115 [Acidobacteria bacterium 13_2_20CM_2_57_6]PYT56232.1 MAG: hypothetical protein DMG46_18165 [Acidobacteriota bacterium]PYU55065.1 MAG: hypothetical protein DMG55_29250 [Acidobacteriota bacterium]